MLVPDYLTEADLLRCPTHGPFLYFGSGLNPSSQRRPGARIIACCPRPHGALRSVLYLDGHVVVRSERYVTRAIRDLKHKPDVPLHKRPGYRWHRDDPHAKGVSWAGFDWGVARVTGQDVQEFRNLMGEERPTPTSIALAPDAVWLGTAKGLFRWDRARRFWSRMAVAGEHFTLSIDKLDLAEGVLSVAAQVEGKPRRFTYDLKEKRWKP